MIQTLALGVLQQVLVTENPLMPILADLQENRVYTAPQVIRDFVPPQRGLAEVR